MKRTIVCGDIHGNFKALKQCLERSGFNYEEDTLIQLGDIVDGYNEVFECIEELLKIKNLILIIGNHDQWFKEFIKTNKHPCNWLQGGHGTLSSYCTVLSKAYNVEKGGCSTNLKGSDIPESHIKLFNNQVLYYKDNDDNIFVHGGFNRLMTLKDNETLDPEIFYWDRDLWNKSLYYSYNNYPLSIKEKCKDIYLGHTATTMWQTDKPMIATNIYNLDTGAGWSGRLTMMDINTKEYWQSDLTSKLYPGYISR